VLVLWQAAVLLLLGARPHARALPRFPLLCYFLVLRADGDHPIQPVEDQVTALSHVQRSSVAKEVQLLARNVVDHADSEDCSSSENWLGFVWLVELDPGEVISCTHASLKA